MELEEMKARWSAMTEAMEQQKKLTDSLIIQMTKLRYRNSINHVFRAEALSSIGCFALAGYIIANFSKLESGYLLACGIGAVSILVILPILSIGLLQKLRSLNIQAGNYKQTLEAYSKWRIRFMSFQKFTLYLTALLMVFSLPVMGALIAKKDLFTGSRLWLWYGIAFILFYFPARWVLKKYNKATGNAGRILKELEEN